MTQVGLPAGRGRVALGAGLIALAALVAYLPSFSAPFVLDDAASISENPSLRHLWSLPGALAPPGGSGLTVSGRPVLNLSLAINYALGGVSPLGYHGVNLAIHIVAAILLFGVLRRTFLHLKEDHAFALSLAAALLWAVHPLDTESVTYVVQRAESLAALFILLTLYGFIRGAESGRARWFIASGIACALGVATKETAAVTPLLVFLYDRTFLSGTFRTAWTRHRWAHAGLACSWLLLGWLVLDFHGRGGTAGFSTAIPWTGYALLQARAICLYLGRTFWPAGLVFDYGPAVPAPLSAVLPELALVTLILVGSFRAFGATARRRRALGFAGLAFFLLLAPSSSIVPIATQGIAEHRMYLPLALVVTVAVAVLQSAFGRRAWMVLCLGAVALAAATAERNRDYRSGLVLWTDTVAKAPDNPRAHYNLGVELGKSGRLAPALAEYEAALRIDPAYTQAHYNLGVELARIPGRSAEALAHYREAVRFDPDYAEARYNLGLELSKLPGQMEEAIGQERLAVQLRPDWAEAREGLGTLYLANPGREGEAASEFREALRSKPDYAEAECNLGVARSRMPGGQGDAILHYENALRLDPNYVDAHYDLANELYRTPGRLDEAITQYEAALALKPDFAQAHVNAAAAYAKAGRLKEAIPHLEAALRIDPNLPGIRDILEHFRAEAGP